MATRIGAARSNVEIDDPKGVWMDVMVKRDICKPTQGISIRIMWVGGGWCASQKLYMMANTLAS